MSELLEIVSWWSQRGENGIALNLANAGSVVLPYLGFAAGLAVPTDAHSEFWFDRDTFAPLSIPLVTSRR